MHNKKKRKKIEKLVPSLSEPFWRDTRKLNNLRMMENGKWKMVGEKEEKNKKTQRQKNIDGYC